MGTGDAYIVGQLVRMATYSGTVASPVGGFRNSAGALIDPATVQLKFKDPSGTITTYTYGGGQIIKDGVGLYHYDVDTTALPGRWTYDWISPNQAISSNWFQVLADPTQIVPLPIAGGVAALDSAVVHKAGAESITGVKHASAGWFFDAGFTVSAGAVSFATAPAFNAGLTASDLASFAGTASAQATDAVRTLIDAPTAVANVSRITGTSIGTATGGDHLVGLTSRMFDAAGVVNKTVTGAVNNGSGLIRITATAHGFATGNHIAVYGVVGTTEANGAWVITAINANTFDLQGSTFTNAYVSGGIATNRPMMYALALTVYPQVDRGLLTGTALNGDDVDGVVLYNGGTAKATEALYVGRNTGFAGSEWIALLSLAANADWGVRMFGAYNYGLDFLNGTYASAMIRLINNSAIYGRNAANAADVALCRINASDLFQIDTALSLAGNATVRTGTGSPNGVVTAGVGSLYIRTDGNIESQFWIKQSGAGNSGWVPFDQPAVSVVTYSASMTPDARAGVSWKVTVTNGTAMTINAPSNPFTGDVRSLDIVNSSGGAMGVITFNAVFLNAGAFTNPANTKRRTITWYYDGTNWVEINRAAADI